MTVLSLISDLGYNDTGVAHVKNIIRRQLPGSTVIDFSHEIRPFFLQQAAYQLAAAVADADPGGFTIVMYNIYYTASPVYLVAEVDGHYIIAPDNGILPLAIGKKEFKTWSCLTVAPGKGLRDVMMQLTEIIKNIVNKGIDKAGLSHCEADTSSLQSMPRIYDDLIECFAVHIDRFQNVVLNIRKDDFEQARKGRDFSVLFIRDENITKISQHYNDVPDGEKLCRFNSAGFMEIAIRNDKAAGLFGFKMIDERKQGYDTIKIRFHDHTDSENDFQPR